MKQAFPAAALLVCMALSACGSSDDTSSPAQASGDKAAGKPIKVGGISSLSGPATFPDPARAAKAVFDQVNAEGGIKGRPIEYIVQDDKADPQVGAEAAHRLVDEEQVVANVASASLVNCGVNAAFFAQRKLLSIESVPSDPVCNASPSFIPVVNGLFQSIGAQLNFAHEQLGKSRLCLMVYQEQGAAAGFEAIVNSFEKRTGLKLAYDERKVGFTEDPTPYLTQAKAARCEALVFDGTPPQVLAIVKAARRIGIGRETALLTLEPAYTAEMAKMLGKAGEGLYTHSDYIPWSNKGAPQLKEWAELMDAAGVPQTFFAQAGYIAARALVQALKSIEGDVTRESVTEAIGELTAFRDPMMGSPLSFAPAKAHAPKVLPLHAVQIRGGAWKAVTKDFIVIPAF